MNDTRVMDEDLQIFAKDESVRAILEIKDLSDENLRLLRDESTFIEPIRSMTTSSQYNSDFEAVRDLSTDMTVEDLIDVFNIRMIENEEYLVRSDYDESRTIQMTKDWLVKIMNDLGWNKTRRDNFWREMMSFEFETINLKEIDVQSEDCKLSSSRALIPSINEIVEQLTANELTAQQLKQIFYSTMIGQRLEDRAIVISGHKTRKKLFENAIKSLTKNRVMKLSLKKLQKDSFEKSISRAVIVDGSATESELERLMNELVSQIVIIDDANYVGDAAKLVAVQLDRSALDGLESKIEVLKTIEFVEEAFESLENEDKIKTNRYIRRSLEEDDRLQEFMRYLNDIAMIGNESLPSSMLYALYLDYCRYRKVQPEFKNQSQFSKTIADSLIKYRYVLSEKTERIKSAVTSGRLESKLIEDILETNLHFKDVYETNKASKVFNLRFDLIESSIQNIESSIYNVTDVRLRRLTDRFRSKILKNPEIAEYVQRYSKEIESMISESVKESTFKTIELTRYLAQQIFMNDIETVKTRFANIESISQLELTTNLRIVLIKDLYSAADTLESIDRAFRYEELDREMIKLLADRKDTKAKKLLKTFSSSVDRNKKQKVRENVITEICKNVRLV